MKALKDNLDEDEIPPQYQFGETSVPLLQLYCPFLGQDYEEEDYSGDMTGVATDSPDYSGEEESSGTPEEGTEETDYEGEEENGEEEEDKRPQPP